jgi:hypothetical protein
MHAPHLQKHAPRFISEKARSTFEKACALVQKLVVKRQMERTRRPPSGSIRRKEVQGGHHTEEQGLLRAVVRGWSSSIPDACIAQRPNIRRPCIVRLVISLNEENEKAAERVNQAQGSLGGEACGSRGSRTNPLGNELAPGDPTMQKGARVFIVYDVEDAGPWLYGFSQGKFGYFHSSLVKSCGDPTVRKIHEVDELERPVSF